MKDTGNLHLKIQELCDCFATTDPLKEMSAIQGDTDEESAAAKWLALAALHGVNANAKKISLELDDTGKAVVTAEYRDSELPSPDKGLAQGILEAVRAVTHIDDAKGETALALGIRDSSLDLKIKVKDKKGRRKVSIKFP